MSTLREFVRTETDTFGNTVSIYKEDLSVVQARSQYYSPIFRTLECGECCYLPMPEKGKTLNDLVSHIHNYAKATNSAFKTSKEGDKLYVQRYL